MFLKFFNGRRLTVNFKCFAFSDQENFRKAMYLQQLIEKSDNIISDIIGDDLKNNYQ